jgi:hypothetical protein
MFGKRPANGESENSLAWNGAHTNSWSYAPMSFRPSVDLLNAFMDIYMPASFRLRHIPGLLFSMVIQPLSKITQVNEDKNGGNPFNILSEDGPLMCKKSHRKALHS